MEDMNKEEVKALRKSLDLSQQNFAVKMGVSIRSVCRWENGEFKPSKLALKELSKLASKVKKTEV